MKEYIEAGENSSVAQTRETDSAVVKICADDLYNGETMELKKEEINRLVYDILYRQAVRKTESLNQHNYYNTERGEKIADNMRKRNEKCKESAKYKNKKSCL